MCVEGVDLYGVGVDILDVWAESLEELLIVIEDFVACWCLSVLLGCVCGVGAGLGMGFGVPSGVVDRECVVVSG